jgi:hypothetical protein
MHYDFKSKLNKIDSQQTRNLKIPEIDWKLNEAQELFVKMVAKPRLKNSLGFETSQRSIDDIRTVVNDSYCLTVVNNVLALPGDYWHFLSGTSYMNKGECVEFPATITIRQHDDDFENSPFDCSSFEWRVVNAIFTKDGIKLHDDGTFTNKRACISYIKTLPYIHNAESWRGGGGYNLPSGELLTGTQDCILPAHTHREIVDLAVLIAAGDLQLPDYQVKQAKLNLNKLN